MSPVLCPKIADYEYIITLENIDSLFLSSYERVPGTEVFFSCLSQKTHVLNGTRSAMCLPTGQWDADIPNCVSRFGSGNGNDDIVTTERPTTEDTDMVMLPYVIALVVLGLACIVLIFLLSYTIHSMRKSKGTNSNTTYDSSRSTSRENIDFWVEMAGPRHFRCHELASSHDAMVRNLRYTNTPSGWSGY